MTFWKIFKQDIRIVNVSEKEICNIILNKYTASGKLIIQGQKRGLKEVT